jgi:hypothetical protein
MGEIAHAAQQPAGDARRAARRRAIFLRALRRERQAEQARGAVTTCCSSATCRIAGARNAEAIAQRRRQQALPRGGADEREARQIDPDRARRRPLRRS